MKMPATERRTIDCEEALRRLAEYLDHETGETVRADVEQHLETCRSCYSRAEFEKELKSRLRELRQEPVDPGFEDRICRLTRGFTAN